MAYAATDQEYGELGAVELMLRGMAIECLLKALWLKRGNVFVKDGHFKKVADAAAHNLPQLAHAVALAPSELEIDMLRRLSHFIEYGGRYPIPKKPEKMKLERSPKGGKAAALTWTARDDDDCFDAFVLNLNQRLS